jgi:hypothetical protein
LWLVNISWLILRSISWSHTNLLQISFLRGTKWCPVNHRFLLRGARDAV